MYLHRNTLKSIFVVSFFVPVTSTLYLVPLFWSIVLFKIYFSVPCRVQSLYVPPLYFPVSLSSPSSSCVIYIFLFSIFLYPHYHHLSQRPPCVVLYVIANAPNGVVQPTCPSSPSHTPTFFLAKVTTFIFDLVIFFFYFHVSTFRSMPSGYCSIIRST